MSDEETRRRLLGNYLNDHLAGATAGVGREIEEDRVTLEDVIDELR